MKIEKEDRFPFRKTVSLTDAGKAFAAELLSWEDTEKSIKLQPTDVMLLVIMYAVGEEVKGATKLEKLPFLLEKECGVKVDHLFKYFPYLHGPYSPKVMEAAYRLAYFKLIEMEERVVGVGTNEEHTMRVYRLTPKGRDLAVKIFKSLPDEHQKALLRLRDFNRLPLRELLKYVYTKYPEVKKYTKLDEFLY